MRERTTEATNPIEQEFLSVIREYERVIYKVCYLYTNPNAPLNDLYQDVILNLWKAYPKFRRECKMSTWIYRPEHVYQLFPQRKECTGNRYPHPRSGLDNRGT